MTRRVATGAGWLYSYRWLERLLDFASIIVLARILSPEDFGLVAIAASVVAIIEGLSAFDVQKALIRSRDDDRALYDSAWTLSTLRGLVAALVMVAVAAVLATSLEDGQLAAVIFVLAASPLMEGLTNPRFVRFERDLVYSKLAILTLGSKIAAVAVTLGLAFAYRSYWALVVGILVGTVGRVLLSYVLEPYGPRFSRRRFGDIFAFSGWLSLTSVVTTLSMETDKIIVGRFLGVADAGRYFMTQRIGVLPTRELVSPLQRLLFPSFSELQGDLQRLRRGVLESVNVIGSLSLPAGAGFALVAADFVPLVLGEQWIAIVPLLVVLVPYLGLRATLSMTLPCVMALGRVQLLFWVSLGYAFVHVPAFVAGTALYGLSGAIWSIVLAGVLYSYLNAWLLQRTLGISLGEILAQLFRPLTAVAVMIAALLLLGLLLGSPLSAALSTDLAPEGPTGAGAGLLSSWALLLGKIAVGAAVYGLTLFGLWRWRGRPPGIERRLLQLRSRKP
ncbi:MAG: lipopolysaccharide biosynthesis protein [Acidobacteriota bacterium]